MANLASRTLASPTGATLHLCAWAPEQKAKAVLLILHGLAEHAARYSRLASELNALGVAVYVHDHRGHGSTIAPDAPPRRFATGNGVEKLLADVHAVLELAVRQHPGRPVFVLGHSMGGLIAANYAQRFGGPLAGLLVWNANFDFGLQERIGRTALRIERALKGSDVASDLFAQATFGSWAKCVRARRTAFDWLSHDRETVDAYMSDPLCGWTPSISMAADILAMIEAGGSSPGLAALPKRLPLHCLGGTEDPATNGGQAVRNFAMRAEKGGFLNVECRILDGARHECLGEAEPYRAEAVGALLGFIDRCSERY